MEARLHRADRDSDLCRDLIDREIEQVPEHHDHPMIRAEQSERGAKRGALGGHLLVAGGDRLDLPSREPQTRFGRGSDDEAGRDTR